MKTKSLNFIVPLVVYPFDLMVSFGETDDQLKKSMDRFDVEWSDNMKVTGLGLFYMTSKNQSLLRLKNIPSGDEDLGLLQHEIFHATTMILDRVGIKLKLLTSCEAYAYIIQFLTIEIYKKLPHFTK